ncbi:MAG: hypothetical protein GY900_11480 [Actinomycetia bacterium]|nr:hypothetical protein [Actinomycetes bacterium]
MSSAPKGERRALDAYYTPDDLARVLVEQLPIGPADYVLEPNVGGGAFARACGVRPGPVVVGVDIDPNAAGFADCHAFECHDFLDTPAPKPDLNWVIGNPPFSLAREHVEHALTLAPNVAFLLRLAFLESADRLPFWQGDGSCLRKVWVLAERPSFTGGATDSAAYGFFWWSRHWQGASEIEVLSWKNRKQVGLFG